MHTRFGGLWRQQAFCIKRFFTVRNSLQSLLWVSRQFRWNMTGTQCFSSICGRHLINVRGGQNKFGLGMRLQPLRNLDRRKSQEPDGNRKDYPTFPFSSGRRFILAFCKLRFRNVGRPSICAVSERLLFGVASPWLGCYLPTLERWFFLLRLRFHNCFCLGHHPAASPLRIFGYSEGDLSSGEW